MSAGSGVLLVGLYLALVKGTGNVLFIVLQSGFFKAAGVTLLPWVYAALNIGYIAVQAAFIQRLKSRAALGLQLLLWALVAMLMLRLALPADAGAAVAAAALVSFMGFDLLFNQFFLHYVTEIFPLQQGKRALPVLHGCTSLAFIASGLLLRMVLNVASPRTVLVGALLSLAAAQLVFLRIRAVFDSPASGFGEREGGKSQSSVTSSRDLSPTSRRLGRAMVAMAFATMAGKYLLDFLYSRQVTATYTTEAELASFFALFSSVTDMAVVASQLVIAGPVLKRIGIAALLGVLPATVLVCTLGAVFHGGFAWVLATQFLFTYLAKTFHNPASGLVLPVLPSSERLFVHSRIAMASSSGSLLVSLGLMAFQDRLASQPAFGILTLVLLAMLACMERITSSYPKAVKAALGRDEPEDLEGLAQALDGLDPAEARDELARMLAGGEARARAAIRLAAARGVADLEALLLPLWGRPLAPKVLATAVRALAAKGSVAARSELLALLRDKAIEPRVRADLAEALGVGPAFPGLRAALADQLAAPAPRLAAAAAWSLVLQAEEPAGVLAGLATLRGMLALGAGEAADPAARAAALAVLGRARHEAFVPELAACLADPREVVARQALDGLAATGGPEAIAALRGYLAAERPAELAARARRGLDALTASLSSATGQLLAALPEEERSLATALYGRVAEPATRALLERVLRLEAPRTRRALAAALARDEAARAVARMLPPDATGLAPAPFEAALATGQAAPWAEARALVPALATGGLPELASGLLLARLAGLGASPARAALDELAEAVAELAPEPPRLRRALAALAGADPFQASLAEELIGLHLPRSLVAALVPLLKGEAAPRVTR